MFGNGSMQQQPMQQQQPEEPPTIEGLQKQVIKLQQYLELFRQQRDNAMSAVSNLQADLALAQHEYKELEDKVSKGIPASRITDYPGFEESTSN